MKPLVLLLGSAAVFAMTALSAQATTLLAGSFCVSLPTKDEDFMKNWSVTSTSDIKIDLVVLTPEEERQMANNRLEGIFSKIMCLGHAQKTGTIAFTVPGIDRFFDTSPLNIVEKSVKEGASGYAGLDAGREGAHAITPTAKGVQADSPPTNVVPAITKNRWTADSLIVSGTLTNSSAVAVQITGVDAIGFDEHQTMITRGSDYTIVHNELAPGEVVNFKVSLKDDTKHVKFVKVLPSWSP